LRYNLSPDELREAGSVRLLPRLAQFLTDNKAWLDAYTLFPDQHDDNFNLALLSLGAWFIRNSNVSSLGARVYYPDLS
jgi:hypothetical protein